MNVYSVNKTIFKTKSFKRFDRYVCRDLEMSNKEKLRLFHDRAENTVKSYTNVIRKYVSEPLDPFSVNEIKVRKFIDSFDLQEDKSMFSLIKPSLTYAKNVRNDPDISSNTTDLVLEGFLRKVGNNFKRNKIFKLQLNWMYANFCFDACMGQECVLHTMGTSWNSARGSEI